MNAPADLQLVVLTGCLTVLCDVATGLCVPFSVSPGYILARAHGVRGTCCGLFTACYGGL